MTISSGRPLYRIGLPIIALASMVVGLFAALNGEEPGATNAIREARLELGRQVSGGAADESVLSVAQSGSGVLSLRMAATNTAGSIVSPAQLVYYHQSDDDGTKPSEGSKVVLVFAPGGRVALLAQSSEDMLAHHGTWRYENGSLSFVLKRDYLDVDFRVPFRLDLAETRLPFRLFSEDAGSSTWRPRWLDVADALRLVFRAAVADEAEDLSLDEAVSEAQVFAKAIIALEGAAREARGESGALYASVSGPIFRAAVAQPIPVPGPWPRPVSTQPLPNGVEVRSEDGTIAYVILFDWVPAGNKLVLRPGDLFTDPRTKINAAPSGNTSSDPTKYQALFILPFSSTRYLPNWWDFGKSKYTRGTWDRFDVTKSLLSLGERYYEVKVIEDERASVDGLIRQLTAVNSPGIVLFFTHGAESGCLATGQRLGESKDEARQAFRNLVDALRNQGLGALVDQGGLRLMSVNAFQPVDMAGIEFRLPVPIWYFTVCPPFWEWLRTQGVALDRTLFFVGACYADARPDLREAVKARAFFGINQSISMEFAGASFDYLIDSLARPTVSTEEAFYNLVRVVNTRETIFKEDLELDGQVPTDQGGTPIFNINRGFVLNGYGRDAGPVVPYVGNGWLDRNTNHPGQLWWLTYAGRWGQDAEKGANNLLSCYHQFWSKGKMGRMRSPFCNAANAGQLPTKDEVAYATYLLTGKAAFKYGGTMVPRWTLNEN